jgi:Protein of unknown function (DUF1800)
MTQTVAGRAGEAGARNEERIMHARAKAAKAGRPVHRHGSPPHPHGRRVKHRKHRRRRRHHGRPEVRIPLSVGLPGAPAPPPIPVNPPPPSSSPPPAVTDQLTAARALRLLWRAGFGPRAGDVQGLSGRSLAEVVRGLARPSGPATLSGPAPTDDEGHALEPADVWGQDHCWWLDRMVRSDQQLVERMTFIWHDWFANSNEKVNSQQRMVDQNQLFREHALGSFYDVFLAVTVNPAMLVFLDGIYNDKWEPNENYAREMMELFSLGADRGAYSETDVREMARALTGWTAEWTQSSGLQNFRFDPSRHDTGTKTVFGQTGNWNWEDAVRLCVEHPLHASFFVSKLWSYFVPIPPDEATLASLQGVYLGSGYSIAAVVEAVLQHPTFLDGPELVTPPVVYNAGLLRAIGRPIDTTAWAWLSAGAGQQLFYPPNVAGWDFTRWLDTSTAKARWEIASYVTAKSYANPWPDEGEPVYSATETPAEALASAYSYWGNPPLSDESSSCIAAFADTCLGGVAVAQWQQSPYRAIRQNALRMLTATSPDMQVS